MKSKIEWLAAGANTYTRLRHAKGNAVQEWEMRQIMIVIGRSVRSIAGAPRFDPPGLGQRAMRLLCKTQRSTRSTWSNGKAHVQKRSSMPCATRMQSVFWRSTGSPHARGREHVAYLGNLGGGDNNKFAEQMKKAQQAVQSEAQKAQQELAQSRFEGYDSDELVQVVFNGNQQPMSTSLTQEAMQARSLCLSSAAMFCRVHILRVCD